MDITTIEEKENTLFHRKELVLSIPHPDAATPSLALMQHALAKQFHKTVEQVDIRSLTSQKGLAASVARVYLWEEKKVADLAKPKEEKKPAQEGS
ncbi:MAG: hypothetical protein HY832_02060 [Candidatus Aenigmarchaeota archaeon]|nr:hypothetical protein [Candidatus Aenigmarchaeota archaeon]